jgi:hypothetical protein
MPTTAVNPRPVALRGLAGTRLDVRCDDRYYAQGPQLLAADPIPGPHVEDALVGRVKVQMPQRFSVQSRDLEC